MTEDRAFCPVYASMQVLQEKWTLHIIRALLDHGAQGFNELRRAVGCNPATLAQRLERLEQLGVLTRTVHSLMPPRTSYELTEAGVALQDVITAISEWGRKYLGDVKARKERKRASGGTTVERRKRA